MHSAKFELQVMKAVIAQKRRQANKMTPSSVKTALLRNVAKAQRIVNVLSKYV
jgi:hypothetical protein